MPKITNLGNIPIGWDGDATRGTFLKPSPTFPGRGEIGPLEPYGYPAYEGYGYPGAGYGTTRSKVVGLEYAKVSAPQLSNKGWEGKVPVGTRVTSMGTLNSKSDRFTQAEVSVLQGLRGLGQGPKAGDAVKEVLTPAIIQNRRAAAWKIISEMDRLYEVARAAKPGTFVTALRTLVDLDAPVAALNNLVTNYYTTLRPRLIGKEGVFEKLNAVIEKPNRNWQAWLDAANNQAREFNSALGDVQTYSLFNLIKAGSIDTLSQIGDATVVAAKELGKRTLTALDWLTNPYVFIPVGLGLAAIYVYARGGGSFVNINSRESEQQVP